MPKLHALELVPDEAGLEALRRDWEALRAAGLPSQLDHTGASNTPHVTVVSAPDLPDAALDVATARLGGLLPVRARVAGVLLLGGARVTVARALDLDDDVVRRVLAVRVQVPDRAHLGWLPHVTLARRVDRADVPRALAALDALDRPDGGPQAEVEVRLTELRRWDPDRGRVTTIAQG